MGSNRPLFLEVNFAATSTALVYAAYDPLIPLSFDLMLTLYIAGATNYPLYYLIAQASSTVISGTLISMGGFNFIMVNSNIYFLQPLTTSFTGVIDIRNLLAVTGRYITIGVNDTVMQVRLDISSTPSCQNLGFSWIELRQDMEILRQTGLSPICTVGTNTLNFYLYTPYAINAFDYMNMSTVVPCSSLSSNSFDFSLSTTSYVLLVVM